jgi:hypothetical protein
MSMKKLVIVCIFYIKRVSKRPATTAISLHGRLQGRLQSRQKDSFIEIEIVKAYTASRGSSREYNLFIWIMVYKEILKGYNFIDYIVLLRSYKDVIFLSQLLSASNFSRLLSASDFSQLLSASDFSDRETNRNGR